MEEITTYVFGENEVKKTGRTAKKKIAGGKFLVVEEVTPVNLDDGTWKKWINPTSLFEIDPPPPKQSVKGIVE